MKQAETHLRHQPCRQRSQPHPRLARHHPAPRRHLSPATSATACTAAGTRPLPPPSASATRLSPSIRRCRCASTPASSSSSNRSGVVGVCRYCASETRSLPRGAAALVLGRVLAAAGRASASGVKFAVNKYGEEKAFKTGAQGAPRSHARDSRAASIRVPCRLQQPPAHWRRARAATGLRSPLTCL
ncbi:MAG: hypothetical protein MZW92_79435 [Comamonadaceae bacterium]|nr:hypothetical protein [Comamonadaceae bacterium]